MRIIGRFLAVGMAGALLGAFGGTATAAPTPAAAPAVASVATHKSLHMRGVWKAGKSYHRNDVVRYLNASYVAKRANENKVPTRAKYWQLLAVDGTNGLNGTNGVNGVNGGNGLPGPAGPVGQTGPNMMVKDGSGAVLGRFMGTVVGDIGMAVQIDGGVYIFLSNGAFVGALEDLLTTYVGGNVFYANDATCSSTPYAAFESTAVGLSYVGSTRRYLQYTNRLFGLPTGLLTGVEARGAFKLTDSHFTTKDTDTIFALDPDGSCLNVTTSPLVIGFPTSELFALTPVAIPRSVPGPLTIT